MCTWWRVNEKICSFQCTGPWGTWRGIRSDGRKPSSFEPRTRSLEPRGGVPSQKLTMDRAYVLHTSTLVKRFCFSSRGKFCFINFIERANPALHHLAHEVAGEQSARNYYWKKAIAFAGTITTYKAPTDEPVYTQQDWTKRLRESFAVAVVQHSVSEFFMHVIERRVAWKSL